MAKIKVKHFAGHKNDIFLDLYNQEKNAFLQEIPEELQTAIKIVSNYASEIKQRHMMPNLYMDTDDLLSELNKILSSIYGSKFLDNPPDPAFFADEFQRSNIILHWLQRKLQRLWLIKLDELAAKRIERIINYQRITGDGDTLLIFTLPEFYFTYLDFGWNAKAHAKIRNYSKPFYSETLDVLLHGKDVSGIGDRPLSLRKLGYKPNVVILAGTFRWKEIKNDNTTEIIYNTLPIFSNFQSIYGPFLWSKIHTSNIDGHGVVYDLSGNRLASAKKVPNKDRSGDAVTPLIRNGRGGSLDAIHLLFPRFSYPIMGRLIQIGIDICADYGMLQQSELNTDIHILIAAGMHTAPDRQNFRPGSDIQAFLRNDGGENSKSPLPDTAGIGTFIQNQQGQWLPNSLHYQHAQVQGMFRNLQLFSEWFKEFDEFVIRI